MAINGDLVPDNAIRGQFTDNYMSITILTALHGL